MVRVNGGMTGLSFTFRLVLVLLAAAVSGMSCEPKKPAAPERPVPRSAAPAPKLDTTDISGKSRNVRRGITPGALEAEGPPPAPTQRAKERRESPDG